MNYTEHYKLKVQKLPHSEIEIEAELPWEELETKRKQAIKNLGEGVDIKGFRKGAIPENILIEHIGDMKILYEQAQLALSDAYPKVLEAEKIDAIGRPEITITKIASGNPLGIKIKTALMPEITLPDYKKIAEEVNKTKENVDVKDEEVSAAIDHIRREWAKSEKYEAAMKDAKDDKHVDPSKIEVADDEMPELTDEFVKKLGNFSSKEEFREKVEENMKKEKEYRALEKKRIELLEKILENTTAELPDVVVDAELTKMLAQFEDEVKRSGLELEKYLEHTGKSIEDLKKEWRTDAEKRAKTQLVLNKIAEEEKITPDKDKVEEEVEKILKYYKDADPLRARIYIATMLSNEKVMNFLESQGSKAE